ncbi:MAG: hypothetical protein ABSH09_17105 [Bryobacteraceae bacterium]
MSRAMAAALSYNNVSAFAGGYLRALSLILRLYSYAFEFVLSLIALVLGIIGATHGHDVSMELLPWTGASLTHWLTGLGLLGIVCTVLAVMGWLRFLFPLWALFVVVMLFRGYMFSSYTFGNAAGFREALYFFGAAVLAFIGSLTVLGRRRSG